MVPQKRPKINQKKILNFILYFQIFFFIGEYGPPEEAADEDYSREEDFSIDDYEDLLPPPEAVRSTLEKELFPDSKI